MKKLFKIIFTALVILGALMIVGAPSLAYAAGSDSKTPYTVTTEGLQLAETGAEDIWWLFILAILLLFAGASTYLVDKIKKG